MMANNLISIIVDSILTLSLTMSSNWTRLSLSGAEMGYAGCAMHKGPVVRGPLWAACSGISFLLSDTECSQINWNLRFSTRTHSTVVLALKEAEWPNCWFCNQPACHTHRGSSFNWYMSDESRGVTSAEVDARYDIGLQSGCIWRLARIQIADVDNLGRFPVIQHGQTDRHADKRTHWLNWISRAPAVAVGVSNHFAVWNADASTDRDN